VSEGVGGVSGTYTARSDAVGHVSSLARPGVVVDEGITRVTRPRTATIPKSRKDLTTVLCLASASFGPRNAAAQSDFHDGPDVPRLHQDCWAATASR
jgi:hypothetical protein